MLVRVGSSAKSKHKFASCAQVPAGTVKRKRQPAHKDVVIGFAPQHSGIFCQAFVLDMGPFEQKGILCSGLFNAFAH
jgi:hypothetical protein